MVKFRCWQRGFTEYVSVNSGRGQPTKLQASEPKPRHVLWAVAKPFRATPALLGQGQGQDECGRWGWGPAVAVWVRGAQFFARGVRGALPPLDRKRVPHPPVAFTCLPPTTTACLLVISAPSLSLHLAQPYPCRPSISESTSAAPGRRRPRRARWNAGPKGKALADSHSPPAPRAAASDAARRRRPRASPRHPPRAFRSP
jgi:hypothetical protein